VVCVPEKKSDQKEYYKPGVADANLNAEKLSELYV
jgi:hypothetical protein